MLSPDEADRICDENFFSAFAWERSRKNNLWRNWHGYHVVVYQSVIGYGWFVKDRYQKQTQGRYDFKSEDTAVTDVWQWFLSQQTTTSTGKKRES